MSEHFERAKHLMDMRRHDLAEKELRAALAVEPNRALSHAYLATCLGYLHRYPEALDAAREGVRLAPDYAYAHHILSWVLQQMENWEAALTACEETLRLDPAQAGYHAQLALVQLRRHAWQKAREAAENGLRIDPQHVGCLNELAWALVVQGDHGRAFELLEMALRIDPNSARTHSTWGRLLTRMEKHDSAIERLHEAVKLNPSHAEDANLLRQAVENRVVGRIFVGSLLACVPAWAAAFARPNQALGGMFASYLVLAAVMIAAIFVFTSRAMVPRLLWINAVVHNLSYRRIRAQLPRLFAWCRWEILLIGIVVAVVNKPQDSADWLWYPVLGLPFLVTGSLLRAAYVDPAQPLLYALLVLAVGAVGIMLLQYGSADASFWASSPARAGAGVLIIYLYHSIILRMMLDSGRVREPQPSFD